MSLSPVEILVLLVLVGAPAAIAVMIDRRRRR